MSTTDDLRFFENDRNGSFLLKHINGNDVWQPFVIVIL